MRGRRRREKQERRQNDEQQSYFSSKEIDSVNLDTNLTCEYRYDLYIAISRSCVTQRIIAIRARTEHPSRKNDGKQLCMSIIVNCSLLSVFLSTFSHSMLFTVLASTVQKLFIC